MDPKNLDASNSTAWPQVQYAGLQEHQSNRPGQEAFEQQLHEAREADTAMPDEGLRRSPPPNVSSDGQQSSDELMGALARSNLLPSAEVLINHEHDTAELRAAKRPRAVNNPQGVAIERQMSEFTNSGGGDGAMRAASALQPAQPAGTVIRGQWDRRPLYSEDVPVILGLEEALIKAGMTATPAKQHVSSLLGFSRWLFAKNRQSIVARLDSKALSDGGDVHEFTGGGNKRLVKALEHLQTFRSTGVAVVRPGRARAKPNSSPQNAALTNPQDAVLIESRRVAAAQHSASQEAGSRPEELQGRWDDQPAPSALIQGHVAFDAEQISQGELRRVLDHLDDQSIPSPASLPSEQLERLEKELHDELDGRGDNHPVHSFSVDPEQSTFDLEQFPPGELRRLLDDESAQLQVDHLACQSPVDE
ncbi:hypothetical protein [Bradyrhizobium paxllaeri]|uniref:hypothetical protein n=1 Tax=Bradyrhizobium paxllaeri TaxID=190148 RepID=UPI000A797233|nr:hypothetical protein [Bradyrhizobium paxllaeri]